jgi:hypothetical protein
MQASICATLERPKPSCLGARSTIRAKLRGGVRVASADSGCRHPTVAASGYIVALHQITTVTPSNSIVALHQITMNNRVREVQSKIAMSIIAFVDYSR